MSPRPPRKCGGAKFLKEVRSLIRTLKPSTVGYEPGSYISSKMFYQLRKMWVVISA